MNEPLSGAPRHFCTTFSASVQSTDRVRPMLGLIYHPKSSLHWNQVITMPSRDFELYRTQVEMSTSFLRDRVNCARIWMRPCRAFYECVCVFSRQIFGFLYFFGYLGLEGSDISSEKKETPFVKGSAGAHLTRVKIQGLSLKNGVDI